MKEEQTQVKHRVGDLYSLLPFNLKWLGHPIDDRVT